MIIVRYYMRFDQIIEQLIKICPVQVISDQSNIEITDVRLFDPHSSRFDNSVLYFGYSSQIPPVLPAHCILSGADETAEDLRAKSPEGVRACLGMIAPEDFGLAFNQAQDLIRRHQRNDFQQYLMGVADRVQNVDALIDIASQSFGASLILCDRDFRIRSYSTQVPVTDKLWLHNIEQGYCDYEFISEVRSLKSVQMNQTGSDPVEVTCKSSPFQKFSSRLYCHDLWVGFILLIEGDDTWRPSHIEMLRVLNNVIGYSIINYSPDLLYRTNTYHSFLYNLLIGAPAETLPEAYLQLPFPDRLQLVYCRPGSSGKAASFPKESWLSERCKRLFPSCHVIVQRDNASVIGSAKELRDTAKLLQLFPEGSDIRFGISRAFQSVTSVRQAQQEAVDALETGVLVEPEERLYPFDRYSVYTLLRHAAGEEDLTRYLHPAVAQLRSDADNALLETLQVYLACGGCVKDAARRLHLHRNSVTYRLGKIESICGINLSDISTCFLLRLSFALLKITNVS